MAIVDIIILVTMLFSVVAGLVRGFIRQAFSLGGLIVGVVLGSMLYQPFAQFLHDKVVMKPDVAQIVAFVIILIVVPILCGILGRLLSKVVHDAGLGIVNRLFGALSGLLIWLLVAGMIIRFMEMTGISSNIRTEQTQGRKASVLYAPVRDVSAQCLQWTWKEVRKLDLPKFEKDSNADGEQKVEKIRT